MLVRLTNPTYVTFNGGASYYYVSCIEDGYYDEDADGEWVAADITLTAERGGATLTLSEDHPDWANASVGRPDNYVDVRVGS